MTARRHFEDLVEGSVETFGPRTITREEIVAYASEYDPQPMHLDEEAAKQSLLGGLAASGWHLCCFMFRMTYDGFIAKTASLGSPGVEEVKWLKPVRPGTALTLRVTVLDKRASKSRPEMGLARLLCELIDETGTPLAQQTSTLLVGRRSPEPAR
jgi:acyl dehydratase